MPARKLPLGAALATAIAMPVAAVAANDPAAEDDGLFAELPTVMSATRLPQPLLYAPVSTTVIDRAEIQASGFTEIEDIFRLVPGFQVAKVTGGHSTVSYHGQEMTFPSRIEVMVDGRSVYDNLLSSVKWRALGIQLDDIETIEVIRGSNATVFGSNALVATINIRTRAPNEQSGTWLNLALDDNGMRRVYSRLAGGSAVMDYSLSLGYQQDPGFEYAARGLLDFDDSRLTNLSLRSRYAAGRDDMLDLQLGLTTGEPGTYLHEPLDFFRSHQSGLDAQHYYLRWTHSSPQRETYLQAYHNRLELVDDAYIGMLYELTPAAWREQVAALYPDQALHFYYAQGGSQRTDVEFQSIEQALPLGKLVWGIGARHDRLETPHIYPLQNTEDRSGRVFANYEWPVGLKGQLNLGGMLEHNELVQWTGSTRLAYRYAPDQRSSWRMSVAQAERSPSMLDEYFNVSVRLDDGTDVSVIQRSYGDIKAERLRSAELGYAASYRQGRWLVDSRLFYERGDQIIGGPTDSTVFELIVQDGAEVITNGDHYTLYGLEGQIKFRPRPHDLISLQYALINSDRYRIAILPDTLVSTPGKFTAAQNLSLLYLRDLPRGFSVSAGWYYLSDVNWLGDGAYQDGYQRVDVRLAKTIFLPKADAMVELIAQNLFDDTYYEYSRERNLMERKMLLKAGFRF